MTKEEKAVREILATSTMRHSPRWGEFDWRYREHKQGDYIPTHLGFLRMITAMRKAIYEDAAKIGKREIMKYDGVVENEAERIIIAEGVEKAIRRRGRK